MMPPKRIPVTALRTIAKAYGCRQVVMVAWDGATTHIVTYGNSEQDCDQAAQGGNFVAKALGWPDSLCHSEPSRVTKLKSRIAELERQLALKDIRG
jgi:hypothetical protein